MFGVKDIDLYGILDIDEQKAHLFVPKHSESMKMWVRVLTKEDYEAKHNI